MEIFSRRIFMGQTLGTFLLTRLPWLAARPAEIGEEKFRLALRLPGDQPLIKAPTTLMLSQSEKTGIYTSGRLLGEAYKRIDRELMFSPIKYEDPAIQEQLLYSKLVFMGFDVEVPITAVGQASSDQAASGMIVRLPSDLPSTLVVALDKVADIPHRTTRLPGKHGYWIP